MPKISIIVSSEKLDKLFEVATLSSTAITMNWKAELFFTFWGLMALKRDFEAKNVTSDYSQYAEILSSAVNSGSLPNWRDLLIKSKESGNLKIYACSTSLNMFGIKKEDLGDFVDEIVGAATFLSRAKDSDINLFIS